MKRIVILQILLCAGIASAAVDPNLVGWWKLDEGTGNIVNDSADSRNGNVYGATWTTGQIGGALSFDGDDDYIGLPNNNPIWLPRNDLTISTWVYFNRDPVCSTVEFVISCNFAYWSDPTAVLGYCIHRNWCDGKAVFQFETSASTDKLYSENVLEKNNWYHIVGVRHGTTQQIYLNGKLEGTRVCSAEPVKFTGTCNDSKVVIGKVSTACTWETYFLDGMIDDVRIYNRALSSEEIIELYQGTEPDLTGIEITGPDEVAENSTASYSAIATYDDGTTQNITTLAEWFVEPNMPASIDKGLLTTGEVLYPQQDVNIYAEFTDNNATYQAEKTVSILAICPQGSALDFDGSNDYVSIPYSSSLDLTSKATLSAWINTRSLTTAQGIVGRWNWTSGPPYKESILLEARGDSGIGRKIRFWISTNDQISGETCVPSIQQFNVNTWYHVAGTYDGNTMKLYINGQLENSTPKTGNIFVSNSNWYIGAFKYGNIAYFNGLIDDVRVYNRVLSAEEISAIMHSKPTNSELNLIAYWDFDEGIGQTATDVSGNGNDGTLGSSSGSDTSDPCWVESGAPADQCTTEQMIVRNLGRAIGNKELVNDLLSDAKAKERASANMIDDLKKELRGREVIDAMKAKCQINIAILQENLASRQIDMTIDRLENALWLLSDETDPNERPHFWFGPWWLNYQPHCLYGPRK